jgi:hypothetical protein
MKRETEPNHVSATHLLAHRARFRLVRAIAALSERPLQDAKPVAVVGRHDRRNGAVRSDSASLRNAACPRVASAQSTSLMQSMYRNVFNGIGGAQMDAEICEEAIFLFVLGIHFA